MTFFEYFKFQLSLMFKKEKNTLGWEEKMEETKEVLGRTNFETILEWNFSIILPILTYLNETCKQRLLD